MPNPEESTFKLFYVTSTAVVADLNFNRTDRSQFQKYIQVTFANYTDSFLRGELDIYNESIHFCRETVYGYIPFYTDHLVRLLVNVQRLTEQYKAEVDSGPGDSKDQPNMVLRDLKGQKDRYQHLIEAMARSLRFEKDLDRPAKDLYARVMGHNWDDVVPRERRCGEEQKVFESRPPPNYQVWKP
jgi:hypothetical protein